MDVGVLRALSAAKEKINDIKKSRCDLGIRKYLLLWLLLREWSWVQEIGSEEDSSHSEGDKSNDEESRSLRRESGSALTGHKRTREDSKDGRENSKRCNRDASYEDNEKVGEESGVGRHLGRADPRCGFRPTANDAGENLSEEGNAKPASPSNGE